MPIVIAVVGCGPRGLSVMERLAAWSTTGGFSGTLHMIDPWVPGAGRVWREDQPPSLIMNTLAMDACLFADGSVACSGPKPGGPSLWAWAERYGEALTDRVLRAEATRLAPTDSPSRRLYGAYLRWVFDECRERLRTAGASVITHATHAQRVVPTGGRYSVLLSDDTEIVADAVVLALGHVDSGLLPTEQKLREASLDAGWQYCPPGDAATQDLNSLTQDDTVLVRGMGLNFFDTLSLLTEGRGGVYSRNDAGLMTYEPSGTEPTILVSSRRGVPFAAKPDVAHGRVSLLRRYPTQTQLEELTDRRGTLDFFEDLWPHIHRDAVAQFLVVALRDHTGEDMGNRASEALRELDAIAPYDELSATNLVKRWTGQSYDPRKTGDPLAGIHFDSPDELHAAILAHVSQDLGEASRGMASARKAADIAIGASREWVFPLVDHGGLTGESHRRDVLGWFLGHANGVAGGPPMFRTEQLQALASQGQLRFLGRTHLLPDADGLWIRMESVAGFPIIRADALVEARIQDGHLMRTSNALLTALVADGVAREQMFTEMPGHPGTGGIEVEPDRLRVVDRQGRPHDGIFAIGVPVGSHVGRSLSPVHGTNSSFFRETDRIVATILDKIAALAPTEEVAAC